MTSLRWIAVSIALTFLFYLPVWFVIGEMFYGGIHPDYWTMATPSYVLPISSLLAFAIVYAITRVVSKR